MLNTQERWTGQGQLCKSQPPRARPLPGLSALQRAPGAPELLLHDHSRAAGLPSLAALAVAAVILLDEQGSPAALLEPLLFVVTPELALDQDGCLSHLLIKCILWGEEGDGDKRGCAGAPACRVLPTPGLPGEAERRPSPTFPGRTPR